MKKQELPNNQPEYVEYQERIKLEIETKHASLIKNAHQYLCYMYLITYNFSKCIDHGKKLLAMDKAHNLAESTKYNVHMYLAEANCMLARFEEAHEHLSQTD